MSYTVLALVGIAFAALLDGWLLRTNLLRRRVFWVSYAIMAGFQLLTNGVLTGRHIVVYDSRHILGVKLAYAPVEDLAFGFSLILQTLSWWVWWGRRLPDRGAPSRPDRPAVGRQGDAQSPDRGH